MTLGLGGLLLLIGAIWFIVLSFQTGGSTGEKVLWAVVNFFFQPIAGIIFFLMKKDGMIPMILVIVGTLLYGYGMFTSVASLVP